MAVEISRTRASLIALAAVVAAATLALPPPLGSAASHEPGVTSLVSVSTGGQVANRPCRQLGLAASGQYAVFACRADNLVPGDTNGFSDIFLRDRDAGATTRVSVSSAGRQANGPSSRPSISTDSTWVVFESTADNLVPGDRNGVGDVFAHNRRTGVTTLVSVDHRGRPANRRSVSGTAVGNLPKAVFVSRARLTPEDDDNSADVYLHSMRTGRTRLLTVGRPWAGSLPRQRVSVSGSGTRIGFLTAAPLVAADRNRRPDAYWYDAKTRRYRLVSVDLHGRSARGRAGASQVMLAPDGKRAVFTSAVNDLVAGDRFPGTDVFVRNVRAGTTRLVSVGVDGAPANGPSRAAVASRDGRHVAFSSLATNLDPGDDPAVEDVFVRDMAAGGTTSWVSRATDGTAGNGHSGGAGDPGPTLAGFTARFVGFESRADNLTPPIGPGAVPQLYVRDRG